MSTDQPSTTTETWISKLDATHLVAALAGLLGLAGYVYVLGGLALYIELYRTGVPAGEAIDEFTSRRYLVVGLPIALIVGLACLLLVVGVRFTSRHTPAGIGRLGTALATRRRSERFARWGAACAAFLRERRPTQPARVLLAIGAVLMVVCLVAVAFVWPAITLRRAFVTTKSGGCIAGAYISTDGDGVHLADGKAQRLQTVPTAEVAAVVIGKKHALSDQAISVASVPCKLSPDS